MKRNARTQCDRKGFSTNEKKCALRSYSNRDRFRYRLTIMKAIVVVQASFTIRADRFNGIRNTAVAPTNDERIIPILVPFRSGPRRAFVKQNTYPGRPDDMNRTRHRRSASPSSLPTRLVQRTVDTSDVRPNRIERAEFNETFVINTDGNIRDHHARYSLAA